MGPLKLQEAGTHFDSQRAEERWQRSWEEQSTYRFDEASSGEVFVIDTPPPTVSGSLHVGHVFSYTQTDAIARYHRMRGRNVFYPMGWDDNGLPTERRVQNYYHVRCEPSVPYEPDLKLVQADDAVRKAPAREISRQNFIELCLALTQEDERVFKTLWSRLALSVDWSLEYSTISAHSRRIAQWSFLDLFRKGHVYSVEAPTMWDVDFRTAVAQAEVEDRPSQGAFHDIRFGVDGSSLGFVISTTRPELLPACVGVTAHPEDGRYRGLFGKQALTPLFRVPVPIFPSTLVDPQKGTGILMVCTFGDVTDVTWWREQGLALRQIIGRNGRLVPLAFGSDAWPSRDPTAANAAYAQLAERTVKDARKRIIELLHDPAASASGDGRTPLEGEPKPVEHSVKYYEKGDRPLEFITTRQWFVRLLDRKRELIELGDSIHWHPDFMRLRYREWTENLQFDWCVSRQRHFGVPFPVWYPIDADGRVDFEHPMVAEESALPVDPVSHLPPGYAEAQREQPRGFHAEPDVFDTWFTSSLTPQIATGWTLAPERHQRLFPMDLRPQSHEIIRTWAFYTIAKAMLHERAVPWRNVAISGWVLDPDRKKMSKSRGNVLTPLHLLDQHGADAVRYWSLSARLGVDTTFDERVIKTGRRLVTKIFNAAKFVLALEGAEGPVVLPLDRGFVARLQQLVEKSGGELDTYAYAGALDATEQLFWRSFTDNYIELVKARTRSESDAAGRASAIAALRIGLRTLLRLFAPFLPYVTEEVWSWEFAASTGHASIHRASWPTAGELATCAGAAEEAAVFDTAVAFLEALRRAKSAAAATVGRHVAKLRLGLHPRTAARLSRAIADVMATARVLEHELELREALGDDEFEVLELELAEAQLPDDRSETTRP